MAVLIPLSGAAVDRWGARTVYLTGLTAFTVSVFPAFWLFGTGGTWPFAATLVVTLGIVHAWFYGAQGTLFAGLFATPVRYTGMSFVYQMSGIFASGVTPLIMTALLALGSGSPWPACGYLSLTGLVSVWATGRLRDGDQHVPTGWSALTHDGASGRESTLPDDGRPGGPVRQDGPIRPVTVAGTTRAVSRRTG